MTVAAIAVGSTPYDAHPQSAARSRIGDQRHDWAKCLTVR